MTNLNVTVNDNSKIDSYEREEITGYLATYEDNTLPCNSNITILEMGEYNFPEVKSHMIYKPRCFEDFSHPNVKSAFPVFTIMMDAFKMHVCCNSIAAGFRIFRVKSKHYRDVSSICSEAHGKLYDCNTIEVVDEIDVNELKGYAIELYDRGVYFKNNIDGVALTNLGLGCCTIKQDIASDMEIFMSKRLYSPFASIRKHMMNMIMRYLFKYLKTFNGDFHTKYEIIEQLLFSIKDSMKDMSDDEKREIFNIMHSIEDEDK